MAKLREDKAAGLALKRELKTHRAAEPHRAEIVVPMTSNEAETKVSAKLSSKKRSHREISDGLAITATDPLVTIAELSAKLKCVDAFSHRSQLCDAILRDDVLLRTLFMRAYSKNELAQHAMLGQFAAIHKLPAPEPLPSADQVPDLFLQIPIRIGIGLRLTYVIDMILFRSFESIDRRKSPEEAE